MALVCSAVGSYAADALRFVRHWLALKSWVLKERLGSAVGHTKIETRVGASFHPSSAGFVADALPCCAEVQLAVSLELAVHAPAEPLA